MGNYSLMDSEGRKRFAEGIANDIYADWHECQCAGPVHTCAGMAGWSNDRPPATGTWTADDDWDGPMELN